MAYAKKGNRPTKDVRQPGMQTEQKPGVDRTKKTSSQKIGYAMRGARRVLKVSKKSNDNYPKDC